MQSKDRLVIELKLDARVLALLAVIVLLGALAFSAYGAQGDEPPSTNDPAETTEAQQAQSEPQTIPDVPEAQDPNLAYTINGEWVSRDSINPQPPAALEAQPQVAATTGLRHVYVTAAQYSTNQVTTACAAGYHMASLWEIYDVSNLVYDHTLAAAKKKDDSGIAPPAAWNGWVHTGELSSGSNVAGTGNCNNWSTTSSSVYGVSVKLTNSWESTTDEMGPWDATSFTCSAVGPVWCVKDPAP